MRENRHVDCAISNDFSRPYANQTRNLGISWPLSPFPDTAHMTYAETDYKTWRPMGLLKQKECMLLSSMYVLPACSI